MATLSNNLACFLFLLALLSLLHFSTSNSGGVSLGIALNSSHATAAYFGDHDPTLVSSVHGNHAYQKYMHDRFRIDNEIAFKSEKRYMKTGLAATGPMRNLDNPYPSVLEDVGMGDNPQGKAFSRSIPIRAPNNRIWLGISRWLPNQEKRACDYRTLLIKGLKVDWNTEALLKRACLK